MASSISIAVWWLLHEGVVADLVGTFDKGNVVFKQFVSNKLLVDEPDIFSPIPKQKLRTFVSIKEPAARVMSKGEIISLKADRNTFAGLFMIGQK